MKNNSENSNLKSEIVGRIKEAKNLLGEQFEIHKDIKEEYLSTLKTALKGKKQEKETPIEDIKSNPVTEDDIERMKRLGIVVNDDSLKENLNKNPLKLYKFSTKFTSLDESLPYFEVIHPSKIILYVNPQRVLIKNKNGDLVEVLNKKTNCDNSNENYLNKLFNFVGKKNTSMEMSKEWKMIVKMLSVAFDRRKNITDRDIAEILN